MRILPGSLLVVLLWAALFPPLVDAEGVLTERTYKRLTVIHQLIGDSKYDEALKRLDGLVSSAKRRPYEYATVMQTYGFVYAATDRYKEAIQAFEAALETNQLPEGVVSSMIYNTAQLYAAIPDYRKAVEKYELWRSKTESPSASAYEFAATIYAQLENYDKAIANIKAAISMSENPKEAWYQLLLAMYYKKKQYRASAQLLETMIVLFPDKEQYWEQLAAVYYLINKDRKALAVTELAYKRGFVTEEKKLVNLVNLYLYWKIPYKAATLLESEMEQGRVARDKDNIEKLGRSWIAAKEYDRAMKALLEAAEIGNDGNLFLTTARLLVDQDRWQEVLSAAGKALATGNLKRPGEAHLYRGMAYFELKQYEEALASFRSSHKHEDSKKQAEQWLSYLASEENPH